MELHGFANQGSLWLGGCKRTVGVEEARKSMRRFSQVFGDIAASAEKPACIGLVGPSQPGKSTVLNLLCG